MSDAGVPLFRDELAQSAREALGVELSALADDNDQEVPFSNLVDVPNSADAVLDAARWRLRRLSRLLAVAARAAR